VVSGQQVRGEVPLVSLLALLAAVVCGAEATIIAKWFPPTNPAATNAVATTVGAVLLLALSVVSGEPQVLPLHGATWAAIAYLVSIGTVGVFLLFLFVLRRWQASAVAYLFVLAPFVSVALAAALLGEGVTPLSAVGAALVLGGIYVATLAPGYGGASRSSTNPG
jgi:O-acetylserine/cysteine efflux transporter